MEYKYKDIRNRNSKDELHGYQEWYEDDELWLRSNYKNSEPIGYIEINTSDCVIGDKGTLVLFYIR